MNKIEERASKFIDETGIMQFTLTCDELLLLLKEAYKNGYAIYEMTDAGLERYDADGYARWVLLGMK